MTLSLSLSVWASTHDFLQNCGENYTTIAVLEYMGAEYPDITVYDENMQSTVKSFDFSMIERNENVISWERSARALGYVEGYRRTDRDRPYANRGVLVVEDVSKHSDMVLIKDPLYAYQTRSKAENAISVPLSMALIVKGYSDIHEVFEEGHEYFVHGEFSPSPRRSYHDLLISPFYQDAAKNAGITDGENYMILDVTGGANEGKAVIFKEIADTYEVISSSLNLYATGDIETLYEFNQQILHLNEGRYFTEDEYASGAEVCIVSPLFMKQYGAAVGDRITLSISVEENAAYYESYWAGTGFDHSGEYEIVGVTNEVSGHNYDIYVPKSADIDYFVNQIGYTVGAAKLQNDGAADFYKEIEPLLPDRMRITIYDQGYAKIKESFGNLLQISKIVTAICMLASFAVIMLFCFLFVYRQRDVGELMVKLGAGKKRTGGYFIFGAGIISLLAGAAGSAAAYGLSRVVISLLGRGAFNQAVSYSRYSNSSSTIVKELIYAPQSGYPFFVYTALGILACILLCVLIFVINTLRDKNKKRRKIKKRGHIRQGHIFKIGGRSLKYAVVSILRGGARTLVVPVAALAAILFLCHMANTYGGYQDELRAIEQSTEVSGMFTDIYGRQVKNAVIEAYQLKDLNNSGYLKDLKVSKSVPYDYLGRYEKDSAVLMPSDFRLPTSGFALETFLDNLLRGNYLVDTNDILSCPEFFFSDDAEITFLEGYDESMLGQELDGVLCCVVSTDFMEKRKVALGDRIHLFVYRTYLTEKEPPTDFKVVGSYVRQGLKDNIYCQLAEYISPSLIFDNGSDDNEELFDYTFDSAVFTLEDTSKIDEFKEFLYDYGFSTPHMIGKYRTFLVLEDEKFNSSLGTLKQQIRYINVLYPVLYTLVGIISMVVSFLLVAVRRKEFAIMRGLGAEKKATFKSFFFEQIMLCVLGAALGVILSVLIYGSVNMLGLILTFGFVLCYTLGCAVSIYKMNNKPVLAVLKYED